MCSSCSGGCGCDCGCCCESKGFAVESVVVQEKGWVASGRYTTRWYRSVLPSRMDVNAKHRRVHICVCLQDRHAKFGKRTFTSIALANGTDGNHTPRRPAICSTPVPLQKRNYAVIRALGVVFPMFTPCLTSFLYVPPAVAVPHNRDRQQRFWPDGDMREGIWSSS